MLRYYGCSYLLGYGIYIYRNYIVVPFVVF